MIVGNRPKVTKQKENCFKLNKKAQTKIKLLKVHKQTETCFRNLETNGGITTDTRTSFRRNRLTFTSNET